MKPMRQVLMLIYLVGAAMPVNAAIRIVGSTVTFTDSDGATIKTLRVATAATGWEMWRGKQKSRCVPLWADSGKGVLIAEKIGSSSPTATFYNQFGEIQTTIRGAKGKFFRDARIALSPLTIAVEAIVESESGEIGATYPGEPFDAILVHAGRQFIYGFPTEAQKGFREPKLVALTANGRFLTATAYDGHNFQRSFVVDLVSKEISAAPDFQEYTDIQPDGTGQLCHIVRSKGCSQVRVGQQTSNLSK